MFGSGGFGTPNKPTGFGAPLNFGTPTTATTGSTNFTFGNQNNQSRLAFGAPAATATSMLGGTTTFGANPTSNQTFGTNQPAANQSFGSAQPANQPFGTNQAGGQPFGGFGTPSTSAPAFGAPSFGAPVSSAPSLFGSTTGTNKPSLFGTATTTSSLFGSQPNPAPLFGGTTTTQAPTLFGAGSSAPPLFGATNTNTQGLFGSGSFGTSAASTTAAPSLFGSTTTQGGFGGFKTGTTAPPSFGGFGTGTTGNTTLGGFGTNTGSNFSFGGTNTGGGLFGKPQEQQPTQDNKAQQTLASFYAINLFGDERDDILKKWNMLQACWGTGKGFYNSQQPPVEYDTCNPFYRFKAISYVVIPTMDNADGYVKLVFNKKETELSNIKQQIINGLNGVLGNKPNLTVNVVHIKGLSDNETEMMITVSEKGVTGTSRKIQATDLAAYFNQPVQKQQLNGAGVTTISAYVSPSKAQLEEYLKEPPTGIDEQLWRAAQIDNPLPQKYLPMPIMGFANLKKRMLCEEFETNLHQGFLVKVNKEIMELRKKHAASLAQIAEQKQKFMQLQHRVLKILVKQECTRKIGLVLQPEEEILKGRLEMMYTHLNMPTQFRGKINEMLSTLKIDSYCQDNSKLQALNKNEVYKMDPDGQEELKQFLALQQRGIGHLIAIVNQDLQDLKIITEGMTQLLRNNS